MIGCMAGVIETRGLTKDFGDAKGIFDLDVDVQKGRVHGFLGPNGAGKTTTIRMLLGFLRPTYGAATVFGHDPWDDPVSVRRLTGFLPGELALPDMLTGRAFLQDSARLRGGVDASMVDDLVGRLDAQLDVKIRKLSKGNKQKIALIDALQHRPPLLILDEPTDGLDPVLRHQVHDVLRQHAKEGGTVFLSSHVVHEIQTTCDDVSIVLEGRLRRQATIEGLLEEEPTRIEATVPDLVAAEQRLYAVAEVFKVQHRGRRIRIWLQGPVLPTMDALLDVHATDVEVRQNDLEETFLNMYRGET